MYLLTLAGEMVLTSGAALKFVTPKVGQKVGQKLLFLRHMTYTVLVRRKTKQYSSVLRPLCAIHTYF
jgi:hypothetical protein